VGYGIGTSEKKRMLEKEKDCAGDGKPRRRSRKEHGGARQIEDN